MGVYFFVFFFKCLQFFIMKKITHRLITHSNNGFHPWCHLKVLIKASEILAILKFISVPPGSHAGGGWEKALMMEVWREFSLEN